MQSMRKVSWGTATGSILIALNSSAAAQARKVDNIGNAGGIVVGGERLAGVYVAVEKGDTSRTQTDDSQTPPLQFTRRSNVERRTTNLAIFGHAPSAPTQVARLALDFFPVDGFSLGLSFIYLSESAKVEGENSVAVTGGTPTTQEVDQDAKQTALILHPRLGYAVAFNETVGLWPRVGLSYVRLTDETPYDTVDFQGNPLSINDETTSTPRT
jgi:hypothetical protein